MVEPGQSAAPASDAVHRPGRRRIIFVCILVFALAAVVLAWIACPWVLRMREARAPQDLVQIQQRMSVIERQMQVLDGRLSELDARMGKNSESESTAAAPTAVPSAALAHVQSDLVALSSAVTGLQAELKQTGSTAVHTQQATQSSLAAAIAFIQLRETAEAGRGFVSELAALRAAVKNDGALQEPMGRLEPYAAKGVPTLDTLRTMFMGLESPVSVAIDKAAAQNWRDRLMAELKGLISIRPLHGGGASDDFTEAEAALVSGDLSAALAATGNLPAEGEDVLKDWRLKAEARQTVDAALHELSDRFIARTELAPPSTRDEP
jgi:hypothetical protein